MTGLHSRRSQRFVAVTTALVLLGLTLGTGSALAHNPAGHQTAGPDGPHYDGTDGDQTASQTAFEQNPTLGGDDPGNFPGGCSVGDSQSHNVDCGTH